MTTHDWFQKSERIVREWRDRHLTLALDVATLAELEIDRSTKENRRLLAVAIQRLREFEATHSAMVAAAYPSASHCRAGTESHRT